MQDPIQQFPGRLCAQLLEWHDQPQYAVRQSHTFWILLTGSVLLSSAFVRQLGLQHVHPISHMCAPPGKSS